jgi:hypothetical protein
MLIELRYAGAEQLPSNFGDPVGLQIIGPVLPLHSGTESLQTRRWRGVDSNFQYAEAIELGLSPLFSCADCLGRVGAPIGVLRFSCFSSTSTA